MNWVEAGEIAKAIAPMFTAGAACFGAWIAWHGLEKWRIEMVGKRKADLAEQALTAAYEARDVFVVARSRGFLGGEGDSRKERPGEGEAQQKMRNTYFIPIERLTREKELFARLQSLRYAFAAHFGDHAMSPFDEIRQVRAEIISSASILIEITANDGRILHLGGGEALLNVLGWGPAERPDDIDRKIEKAFQDIKSLCHPVLTGARSATAPTKRPTLRPSA
jgi:hypothetical protein